MTVSILTGNCLDVLATLDAKSVQCCVTSPPYWGLRDYGHEGQIGLEQSPDEYVGKLVAVFAEVRRVLADDGTLWLNLGDSYAGAGCTGGASTRTLTRGRKKSEAAKGSVCMDVPPGLKPKDLVGIPWRVAFALQADGWYLRSDIIWAKGISGDYRGGSCMPESVRDRPTKSHEYLFLLSKRDRYFYDADAVAEQYCKEYAGKSTASFGGLGNRGATKASELSANNFMNRSGTGPNARASASNCGSLRSVWHINPRPYSEAHFATFPPKLASLCLLAGSRVGDTVLDPFGGSGTVGQVATDYGRHATLIELNPDYVRMAERRTAQTGLLERCGA